MWIVYALVSSITLVTLFSESGLVLTAVALTLLTNRSVLGAPRSVGVLLQQKYDEGTTIHVPSDSHISGTCGQHKNFRQSET